jgi:hypothetical protein
MHPFIINMPFMALTAYLFFVVAKMFPENIHLCMGFITMWFFLCDVRQKIVNDTNSRDSKINTIVEEIGRIRAEINSRDANYTTEAQNIISTINNANTNLMKPNEF